MVKEANDAALMCLGFENFPGLHRKSSPFNSQLVKFRDFGSFRLSILAALAASLLLGVGFF